LDIKKERNAFFGSGVRYWQLCLLLCYILLSLPLVLSHEPFGDELQAWLIARDLSWYGIFYQMRFEGHFALWSWLLHPLAAGGLPVLTMNILSLLLSLIAAFLFIFYSPFNVFFKTIFLFSFPCLYYFPAVARCYALIPLALWFLAICYTRRAQYRYSYVWALLLLAHSHPYMEGMVAVMSLLFFYETISTWNRQKDFRQRCLDLGPFFLLLLGLLVALAQVIPAFWSTPTATLKFTGWLGVWFKINEWPDNYALPLLLPNKYMTVIHWLCLFILLLLPFTLRRSIKLLIIYGVSILWMFIFAIVLFGFGWHRSFLPLYLVVFIMWVYFREIPASAVTSRRPLLWTATALLLPSFSCFPIVMHDLKNNFSDIRGTSRFIAERVPVNEITIAYPFSTISMFSAYLPHHSIRCHTTLQPYTFFHHANPNPTNIAPLDISLLFQKLQVERLFLIVPQSAFPVCLQGNNWQATKIYQTPPGNYIGSESFVILQVTKIPQNSR